MRKYLLIAVIVTSAASSVFTQEDSARASGLPTRIGGNRCSSSIPGSNATVVGSLNVQGTVTAEKPPVFTVILYSNGMLISRQKVKNGGGFNFGCVPTSNVVLVAEMDSIEIASHSLGLLDGPPMTNRHDMFVNWNDAAAAVKRRNEVISARSAYARTGENQKLFDKAMEALDKKKPDNAAKLLEQIAEADPKDFIALSELGLIHFNDGKFEPAAVAYEKAFAVNEKHVIAAIGAGRAYIALKRIEPAIAILSRADAANPDSADINHYLGEAHLQNKKGSLAIVHMRKAIELAPADKADLYLRIGALYHAAGGKNLAADEYRKLLALKPEHPDKERLLRYISENGQ